jgi:hypothetical protein
MSSLPPFGGSDRRPALSGPEQHEFLQQQLGRNRISRRNILMGSVGAVGATFLLGNGYGSRAFADQLTSTGTIADGFVVNGRHVGFGSHPQSEMWVAGQLFNLNHYNAVPLGFKVSIEYGTDRSYGASERAELRELITHVPVWNGVPTGPVKASLSDVLKADQFYVHAFLGDLRPGETYHYRFVYTAGKQIGYTPDATFMTAPDPSARQPFTFTAYGDMGITGAPGSGRTIDNAVSLQPETDSHVTDDYYDATDPDYYDPTSKKAPTDISPVAALVHQITRVRNPHNHTPTRFNLLAGDICYANPSGDAVAIINPDGKGGTQPGATTKNTPAPPVGSGGWDDFDPYVWTSYLSTIEPSSASTPWMFATGNHDVELFHADLGADATTRRNYGSIGYGGHAKRLDMPENGPGKCPSVYSFVYSNVAVISVDANDLSYEIQGLLGYSEGSQSAWLKKQLAHFRAEPGIDFIIAFFHHCAFSTCSSHSSDGGVRATLAPLFAEFEVDLAIQGHNHLYERTNPIRYDKATNSGTSSVQAVSRSAKEAAVVHPAKDGTTYVVCGSAGRPRYTWGGPEEIDRNFIAGVNTGAVGNGVEVAGDQKAETGPYVSQRNFTDHYETINWSQARYRDYAFIALDVVPARPGETTTMTLRAINEHGAEFDRVVFKRTAK